MNIQKIHEDNMSFIRALAADAITEINSRYVELLAESEEEHYCRMQAIDHYFEERENQRDFMDAIAPHKTVGHWFDELSEESQLSWHDTYHGYMYGPNGDSLLSEDDYLSWEVMALLQSRDTYLKQPFCSYCDSRGHRSGECISK
ncbi:hypothetical protein KUL42_39260 [Alteromonas sp. KUL42]|uniref:hypothetical protein n=1 Tax=Alteromonas sp. KUL42 TaxID=2480797 RepID=UPI0010359472|nr:hypothetical protein [Alteromonas sp. KUL42]TAP31730.1 hypothetical protein EYR97_19780 [Alteromonas sp. KUL42]GEA09165.1 hypothetical protein KUL42_39260 [Alteromonas sp. KUL42]